MKRFVQLLGGAAVLGAIVAIIAMTTGSGLPLVAQAALPAKDSCGYQGNVVTTPINRGLTTAFSESETLASFSSDDHTTRLFYTDEHTLTLGRAPITPFTLKFPNPLKAAQIADQAGTGSYQDPDGDGIPALNSGALDYDASGRVIYPSAYITDQGPIPATLPDDANTLKGGDWQRLPAGLPDITGATRTDLNGNRPNFVAGTWKAYGGPNVNTNDTNDNGTWLGPIPPADTHAAVVRGAEIRWDYTRLKLADGSSPQPGHLYRVQMIVHDGDQNKGGGDTGEGCAFFKVPPTNLKTKPPGGVSDALGGFHDTVVLGGSYSDTAQIAQDPPIATAATGSVHFDLFPPGNEDCLSGAIDAGTDTTAPFQSNSMLFDVLGKYTWQATYTPDAAASAVGYFAATEACGLETVQTVEGRITLSPPEKTNAVATNHTVTATVEISSDGTIWVAVSGKTVNFTVTSSNGAACLPASGSGTTNASGQTSVTFKSNTAGDCTVNATSSFTITTPAPGIKGTFVLATNDGGGLSSSDAVKHYLDAKIVVSPLNAVNIVNAHHVVTATVSYTTSKTGPYTNVPAGIPVTFSIINNTPAGTCVLASGSSFGPTNTDANGQATVEITSSTAGSCDVRATTTVTAAAATGDATATGSVTRTTGSQQSPSCDAVNNAVACNSADAHKVYINPKTDLTVSVVDTLVGLPTSSAGVTTTGTVVYARYSGVDANGNCTGLIGADTTNIDANGNVVGSPSHNVGNGTTYFQATYNGNLGSFTSPCAAESVTVVDQVP